MDLDPAQPPVTLAALLRCPEVPYTSHSVFWMDSLQETHSLSSHPESMPNTSKSAPSGQDLRSFIKQQRQLTKSQHDRLGEVAVFVSETGPKDGSGAQQNILASSLFPAQDQLTLNAGARVDGKATPFTIALPVLRHSSRWIDTLFSEGSWKETNTRLIEFPEISAMTIEEIIRFCELEYKINGPTSHRFQPDPEDEEEGATEHLSLPAAPQRVVFQFEVKPDIVMDLVVAANFLQIEPLLSLATKMLAFYIEQVPSIESLPSDLVLEVIKNLTPLQLISAELRGIFSHLQNLDTTLIWKDHCDRWNYRLEERQVYFSWSENVQFLDSYIIPSNDTNTWRSLYAEQLSRRIVSRFTVLRVANRSKETSSQSENAEPETDLDAIMSANNVHLHAMSSQKLLEILRVVAPFVQRLSVSIDFDMAELRSFRVLRFLEVVGRAASDTALDPDLESGSISSFVESLQVLPDLEAVAFGSLSSALSEVPLPFVTACIQTCGTQLKCLDMRSRFGDAVSAQEAVRASTKCLSLTHLGIQNGVRLPNWMPKSIVEPALQILFDNLHNLPQLSLLYLRAQHPKTYGLELRKLMQHKNLKVLMLRESDQSARLADTALSHIILNIPTSIECLDISKCYMAESSYLAVVSALLARRESLTNLRSLNLGDNGKPHDAWPNCVQFISTLPSLRMVDLNRIQLSNSEVLQLIRAVTELDELDLTDSGITAPTVETIADILNPNRENAPKIRRLYINVPLTTANQNQLYPALRKLEAAGTEVIAGDVVGNHGRWKRVLADEQ